MINPRTPDYDNTPASDRRPQFHYQRSEPPAAPVVSIVTPYYNTGPIFEETARCVRRQSLQEWEWIIVNDGSTDPEALRVLDAYRSGDSRIRVIDHPENKGLPAARNTGARAARTEYLLYLDSDDLLEPTAAEKWLWFLESYPQFAFAGGYVVGFGAIQYLWHAGFQNGKANLERNQINHIVMIRKEVVEAVGGYDESMRQGLEDWDFWVRAAARGYWGDSVTEFLHWYRTRASHTDRWEGLSEQRLNAKSAEFRQRYPRLWQGEFPAPDRSMDINLIAMREDPPCANRLQKPARRLLILAPGLVTGGAEKFNLDLMRQLKLRGWELTIATTMASDNPWQHEFEAITPDVFPMANFLEAKDYPRFLNYLVQSRQVDALLVAASQETYRLLPYLRARLPQLPILDYIHFVTPEWMDGGFPRLSMLFESCLDLSAVTSQQVKQWMIAEGAADPDRIFVCTANIDVHAWRPDPQKRAEVRQRLGLADDTPLILYIARLEQQKQPLVLAKTMRLLAQQKLPFLTLIAGDGSLSDALQNFIYKENLQNQVRMLGNTPQEQVRELMAAGDIVFLPSENEGIALTIFEGMACGVMPVGAHVGGQPELVTPDCGILIERSTEDQEAVRYAEVLADLIRQPELRRQMGKNSRARVEQHFSLEVMGERMEALITEAGRLRREMPRPVPQDTFVYLMGRQTAEYIRAVGEVRKVAPFMKNYMPPASAKTYLYFAFRQMIYPLFGRFREQDWFLRIKSSVKSILVR